MINGVLVLNLCYICTLEYGVFLYYLQCVFWHTRVWCYTI